jgi:hypothetical protein
MTHPTTELGDEGADGSAAQPRPGSEGAPPSNTAPDKYTGPIERVLRFGVDSLYLSYSGTLSDSWNARLAELKRCAQSDDSRERALAQVKLGDHLFEVKDKGKGRYAFVLQDNAFHVAISRGEALPVGYVQVGSEFLAYAGPEEAEKRARFVLASLGLVRDGETVSRADLFVDFIAPIALDAWPTQAWITRAAQVMQWWVNGKPSGWTVGQGGDISARLYDKTLEIRTSSRAAYNYILWADRGWNGEQVYRLEVQLRRAVLKELGINTVTELVANQQRLWRYFTQDWLRLALPSADNNRSRWATDPLWLALSDAPITLPEGGRLKRFRFERLPEDERLLRPIAGFLTSFMAKRKIRDPRIAFLEVATDLRRYYDTVGNKDGGGFAGFIESRVSEKGKRFNSCHRPAYWSHFVIGIKEPTDDRHIGASAGSA